MKAIKISILITATISICPAEALDALSNRGFSKTLLRVYGVDVTNARDQQRAFKQPIFKQLRVFGTDGAALIRPRYGAQILFTPYEMAPTTVQPLELGVNYRPKGDYGIDRRLESFYRQLKQ